MNRRKAFTYSYIISFFYVGWATAVVLSLYPEDIFFGDWATYSMIPTFPVAIISFMYRFTTPDSYWPVVVIQGLNFLALGPILYKLFFRKSIVHPNANSKEE